MMSEHRPIQSDDISACRKNTHQRLKDPTRYDAPDSDEEAWVEELFIRRATILGM